VSKAEDTAYTNGWESLIPTEPFFYIILVVIAHVLRSWHHSGDREIHAMRNHWCFFQGGEHVMNVSSVMEKA